MKILEPPKSGSAAGVTASRNRFGQYLRSRSIPVNPSSAAQGLARARMSASSEGWRLLTPAQRAGWSDLGLSITRTDSLGQSYTLQGNQCYASINNIRQVCGLTPIADAPAVTAPVTLLTAVVTLTAAAFSIAFTTTPLGAATYLIAYASPQRSPGRAFENDYRLIVVSTAAQASPLVLTTAYTAKFGVPVVGNRVFISLVTATLGFESGPLNITQLVA